MRGKKQYQKKKKNLNEQNAKKFNVFIRRIRR